MTKQEFEQLTGLMVEEEAFEKINTMYMACGDGMDKQTFCKLWKGENFYILLNAAVQENKKLSIAYDTARDEVKVLQAKQFEKDRKLAELLVEKAVKYDDRELNDMAIELIGHKEVVLKKLDLSAEFWDDDVEYIFNNLK